MFVPQNLTETERPAELAEALAPQPLQPGEQGPAVALLQRALLALSYLSEDQIQSGPGVFGPKTASAVRLLQEDWKLDPTGALCAETRARLVEALRGAPPPAGWTGKRPAPGTADTRHWIPVEPPTRSVPAERSRRNYEAVLEQFAVDSNPRYAPRSGNTYGHIFVWDVTVAMGVEVPHWVDGQGNPSPVGQGREVVAADVPLWLDEHGETRGWRWVSAEEAQTLASQGHPVVAAAQVTDGTRVAMVRPGPPDPLGPWVALAGSRPRARALAQEALSSSAEFWVNEGIAVGTSVGIRAPDLTPRSREIRRGDSGQDVLWLQEALVALGHLSRNEMGTGPGAFGPRTEAALKSFQQKAGVPATGVVGILTRGALQVWLKRMNEPVARSPGVVLDRGMTGRDVWSLQNALLRLDLLDWDAFVISPGLYGPKTETAVRTLQANSGLLPTGIYGPRTHEALERALAQGAPAPSEEVPILGAERAIAFAMNPPPDDGPRGGKWHGCAMALVREAYRSSMRLKGPITAERAADAHQQLVTVKRLQTDGNPPRGALVFFRHGAEGYVGISLGDGRCVGANTAGPASDVRPIWTTTYLGWAKP